MKRQSRLLIPLAGIVIFAASLQAADETKIVLIAGQVKEIEKPGHHDYLGGCRLMQALLKPTAGLEPVFVETDPLTPRPRSTSRANSTRPPQKPFRL